MFHDNAFITRTKADPEHFTDYSSSEIKQQNIHTDRLEIKYQLTKTNNLNVYNTLPKVIGRLKLIRFFIYKINILKSISQL